MTPRPLSFAIVRPTGEVLLEGHLRSSVDTMLVLGHYESSASEEDCELIAKQLRREFPGVSESNRWIPVLAEFEKSLENCYLIAWGLDLIELHEERSLESKRSVHGH